jgi:UMF1 family MFS transporter
MSEATAGEAQRNPAERIDRGAWSWALFEWARNPYVILCGVYVMAPYITNIVVGDPVRGQEMLARWHTTSGVTVALTAPFLGAAADSMRRRKPLLAAVLALMIPAILIQWFAMPGEGGLPLWGIGAAIIVAGISFAWTEVLHNAMITGVTPPKLIPAVSGLGMALGNAAGVLLLVFVLFGIALPGTVLPGEPLFGLDPAAHEPARSVAVICGLWLLVFSIPLFLYSPDGGAGAGASFGAAVAKGATNVLSTLRKLRQYRNVATFLLARMFYADGTTAILIFSGAYASGVMGWDLVEMLLYGVVLSIVAVSGGFVGAWLEGRIGSRNAVATLVAVTFVCLMAMVSMSPDSIFFMPVSTEPVWDGPVFQTAPELAYLGASMLIAISITGAIGSGRSLMAKLCPPGMEGELFGLYALANAATVWLGPLLVERFTSIYPSQRAGFAAIGILLFIGVALLMFVKSPDAGGAQPNARSAA